MLLIFVNSIFSSQHVQRIPLTNKTKVILIAHHHEVLSGGQLTLTLTLTLALALTHHHEVLGGGA